MAATDRLRYPIRLGSRMLPTDALFWYAEEATPELRPLVAGLFLLDCAPDADRFRISVERLIARIPRLQQRVVEAPLHLGLPEWEDDLYFELDYHLRDVVLPQPASLEHLFEFTSAVFATPLDHLRPLWEGYLIEGLENGRAAYLFKAHHSVIDGVGSLALFEAFTQAHRADPVRLPRQALRPHAPRSFASRLVALLRDELRNATVNVGVAAGAALNALRRPLLAADDLARTARGLRGVIDDLRAPLIRDPLAEHATGFGRRLDGLVLSLPRLQRLKEMLGVSLNDVILTAVAGAVGRYHDGRGVHIAALNCMVPMNLRHDHERHQLGNRVGMCNISLPVGEPDPMVRLDRIRVQTCAAKADRRGAAYPVLIQALGFLPGIVFRALVHAAVGHVNLVCTNVPGPQVQRYLAGAKVEVVYPYAAVMTGTPLSVALLSYGDALAVGIDTDPAAIPDPQMLHRYLQESVAEMELRAAPPTGKNRARPARSDAPAEAVERTPSTAGLDPGEATRH